MNPGDLSSIPPASVCRAWPGLTRHQAPTEDHKLKEVPASDPEFLASLATTTAGTAAAAGQDVAAYFGDETAQH